MPAPGDENDLLTISSRLDYRGGRLSGGSGDDTMRGNDIPGTRERLLGGSGDDALFGRGGTDLLDGGPGADDMSGGRSREALTAGICLPDLDTVTYASRTKRVHATADGFAEDDGQIRENDFDRGGRGTHRGRRGQGLPRWHDREPVQCRALVVATDSSRATAVSIGSTADEGRTRRKLTRDSTGFRRWKRFSDPRSQPNL